MVKTVKTFFSLIALLFVTLLQGQIKEIDWIDFSKPHLKFKYDKDQLIRVDFYSIEQGFIQLNAFVPTIPFDQFRIFNNGKQVPILVYDQNNNNVWDPVDYIEFMGHRNDGSFDSTLFNNTSKKWQRHQFQSFYTDFRAYYLTYRTTGTQLKYINATNTPEVLAPFKQSHKSVVRKFGDQYYFHGRAELIGTSEAGYSKYMQGEGFYGPFISAPVNRTTNEKDSTVPMHTEIISAPFINNTGFKPYIQVGTVNTFAYYNFFSHFLIYKVSPDGSTLPRRIGDTTTRYNVHTVQNLKLNHSDFTQAGMVLQLYNGPIATLPKNASVAYGFSHYELVYPRSYKFGGASQYAYSEPATNSPTNIQWEDYGNGSQTEPLILDETNNLYYKPVLDLGNKSFKFTMPGRTKNSEICIIDAKNFYLVQPNKVEVVRWPNYASHINTTDFIMITDSALIDKKGTLEDYVNFKQSQFNNTVRLLFDNNLYDAFSYGIEHPLAIRNYCKYLLDNSTTVKPKFLFLIGRGFEPRYNRGFGLDQANLAKKSKNFLPMMGQPASDNMLTEGLDGAKFEPAIPTGRFPADEPEEIEVYLQKQKDYASLSNQYVDWRKRVLHLGGGIDANQSFTIASRLRFYGDYFVKPFPFHGTVSQYSKSASDPNSAGDAPAIANLIDKGVGMVTFLGHGSSTTTDIEIKPENFKNELKYPIFYFNGCQIGNPGIPGGSDLSLGENIIKGSSFGGGGIAFIAQSSISELFQVLSQMQSVYRYTYNDTTKKIKTIGEALKYGIKEYQNSASELNIAHCQQLILQGDPSTAIYKPDLPDFSINTNSIFLDPPDINALSDSFNVGVVIKNNGKSVLDSFTVEINRIYDGTSKRQYLKRVRLNKYIDTIYVNIRSKDARTGGLNLFDVSINTQQKPVEFTYTNNKTTFTTNIPGNGTILISPKDFDIIHSTKVKLKVQPYDLFRELYAYYIELDTVPSFNSGYLRKVNGTNPVIAGVITEWDIPNLNPTKDTQTYYWRARLSTSNAGGGNWVIQSFTYINNHPEGWMQNNANQFILPASENKINNLIVDSLKRKFEFPKISKSLYLDCDYNYFSRMGVKEAGFGSQDLNYGIGDAIGRGLVLMFWDARKLERVALDTNLQKPAGYWGGRWKTGLGYHFEDYQIYYAYDMSTNTGQDKLIATLNGIPDSMYITGITYNNCSPQLWKQEVFDVLKKIGCNAFDTVGRRTSDAVYAFIGRKGWVAGKAREEIGFGKYIQLQDNIYGQSYQGNMFSESIGPVDTFYDLFFNPILTKGGAEKDDIVITVNGIDNSGKNVILKSTKTSPISLRDINTKQFPYIKLGAFVKDAGSHSAPNLVNWRLTHSLVPDVSLFPLASAGYIFNKDSLNEGDSFFTRIPIKNIGKLDFRDSLALRYSIIDRSSRQVLYSGNYNINPLKKDSSFMFKFGFQTRGLNGTYSLILSVNPDNAIPEVNFQNNSTTLTFVIVKDKINPLLDVTFDNRHIMDGDIVSSSPKILITSIDENKLLWQTDPNKINIEIQDPGAANFRKIVLGTDATYYAATDKNNKAKIEYNPINLETGTYILKVQSEDVTGNLAGTSEYLIAFNVDRNQSVTQFYPYPNPVTNKMKFVFTLTGESIPEEIKIRITNSSGVVVKEISKAELGDIHIGNNITDWSWDGRDQYNDLLANGPYFYTVTVKQNGENVKLRETKGDVSFKNQTGVIYLLR